MGMRKIARLVGAVAMTMAAGLSGHAIAQPLSPDMDGSELIGRNRPDRRVAPAAAPPSAPARKASPKMPAIAPFMLTAVRIEGASLAPSALKAATIGFIGRTMDAAALSRLTQAVSAAYSGSDIALYTVAVPQQDFAQGLLRLIVAEGYIAHIDITGDVTGDLALVRRYAQAMTRERPLRKSTFQRNLSLIRDIPGLTLDARLLDGGAPGAVRLLLHLAQDRYHLDLGLHNRGTERLGNVVLSGDLSLFGLFRQGDLTRLTLGLPTSGDLYQFVGLTAAQPVGGQGLTAQASLGYLHTKPEGLPIEGEAETLQLLLRRPLIRSFTDNLFATLSFDGLNSDHALFGQLSATERVRAVRLASSFTHSAADSLFSASASVSFGMDALGAKVTAPASADTDFRKLTAALGYNHAFGRWIARLKTTGQYADTRLPASELAGYGGAGFGRAFASSTIQGDQGLAGSAELAWRPAFLPALVKGGELFGFADDTHVWLRRRGARPARDFALASAGGGIRVPLGSISLLEIQAAKPLAQPAGIGTGWQFGFALKASY
jgi:hemolysin activation/secretion protein